MAKVSAIQKNNFRKKLVCKWREKRERLKTLIKDPSVSVEDRIVSVLELSRLPRNSSKVRIRNRCCLTGRPRAFYRKFGLSRIALRDLASNGEIPGLLKASW